MSELAQKYNNYLAPEAIVWINGQKLSKSGVFFSDLKIDMILDGADTFSFSVCDAIDFEFEPRELELFSFGDKVEIHIGYADNTQSEKPFSTIFKGIITSINWSFNENNYLEISVEGKDYSFLLMKHKYSSGDTDGGNEPSWSEVTHSKVVEQVLNSTYNNLFSSVQIDDTGLIQDQIRHQEENDYAFISSLAQKNNLEFFVQQDELFFRKAPELKKSSEDVNTLSLYYGKEILSFTPEFNVDKQVTKVKVIGVELSSDKSKIIAQAPSQTLSSEEESSDFSMKELLKNVNNIEYEIKASVKNVQEAEILAQSVYDNLASSLLQGELRSVGVPELRPGIALKLEGLGSRFSKQYYISKAVHSFNDQGYETNISIQSNTFTLNASEGS